MIRELRARHRAASVALALGAPALLAAALLARRSMPVHAGPLPGLPQEPPAAVEELFAASFDELPLRAAVGRDAGGALVLRLEASADLELPDLLVYWAPEAAAGPGEGPSGVPQGARLLGSLGGAGTRRYALPPAAEGARGRLVLYSLARQERAAEAPLAAR